MPKIQVSTIYFEQNYGYYLYVFFQKGINFYFQSKIVNRLFAKLRKIRTNCQKNIQYAQKLLKRDYTKSVYLKTYTFGNKIWLKNKYIETKQNWKLEAKFFRPF